jgi:hypothetical protein
MASNDHVERRATAPSVQHSFALRLARQPSGIAYRRPPTAASWRSFRYRYRLVLAVESVALAATANAYSRPRAALGDRPLQSNEIANFPINEHWRRCTIEESIPCGTMMPAP